jgi:Zn-finger nucleic acid-binding protein
VTETSAQGLFYWPVTNRHRLEAIVEIEDFEIVELELKYCEYCGGLWLRRKGEVEIYCANCVTYISQCTVSSRKRTNPRLPGNTVKRIEGEDDGEIVVWVEGGNA